MNRPRQIFIHCTATKEGWDHDAADIRAWHTAPPPRGHGWSDIGYHRVIRLDGTNEIGRDTDHDGNAEEHVGAHAYGHNQDTLAVVYVGGCDKTGKPKDTRTKAQREALFRQVEEWKEQFDIPTCKVFGHYEVDRGKACPSFNMDQFRSELMKRAAARKSGT